MLYLITFVENEYQANFTYLFACKYVL